MAVNPLLAGLLSNETVRSIVIWQIFGQLAGAIMDPITTELRQAADGVLPNTSLSPADAVDAVIKGHWKADEGAAEASNAGINRQRFDKLVEIAGEPLALELLTEAWRRGYIPKDGLGPESVSLQQGVYESRLKNKWLSIVEKLQFRLADPGVVIEGWLRAQILESEARDRLRQAGVDNDTATLMYLSAGRPPSPQELADALHRGLIPRDGTGQGVLSMEQGFFETDLKNKWWPVWRDLQTYWPPPRTVTAMVREGALPDDEALSLFKGAGLSDKLAGQYLAAAHHQKVAPEKELAKSEILKLYQGRLIDRAGALKLLDALGYRGAVADWLLQIQDFLALNGKIQAAVNKLRALFVARKIDAGTASNALKALHAPSDHVDELLRVWALEREATVHTLTAAQWASAAFYQVVSEQVAIEQIEGLGWPAFDAWALVALRFKDGQATAQPGPPPPPPTPSGA